MNSFRSKTSAWLTSVSDFVERNPGTILSLLVFLYLSGTFDASRSKPLWHDELFTYYIAQSRTLGQMWTEIATLDLNPPLVYLLTRLSFHIFGVNTFAARIPEIVGFLIALLCAYRFVRIRLGVLFGAFAAALLLVGDVYPLAFEARPYSLLLGSLGVAMVAWQALSSKQQVTPSTGITPYGRRFAVVLLFFAVLAMMLSHILAVLPATALVAAQLWHTYRRRLDLPVTAALILPFAVAFLFIPNLKNHGAAIYPPHFQVDASTLWIFYINSVYLQIGLLCLTALAVFVLLGPAHLRGGPQKASPVWFFTSSEWVLIVGLLLCPLILLLRFMASHSAFFDRYGAVEGIGVAMLATAVLCRWTMNRGVPDRRAALLGTVLVLALSGLGSAIPRQLRNHNLLPTVANSEPHPKPCGACILAAAMDPTLPLVDTSGLTFVEMNHNEPPATLDRLFYLTDAQASTQYAHANIFEPMADVVRAFHLAGHAEPYYTFTSTHPHFFVLGQYDYPEDWLLRKLKADGADVRIRGTTNDSYHDTEFYEVHVAAKIR